MSSGIQPVAVYAMRVPPGDVMVPAVPEFAAMFRLTMAAIDPTAEPELEEVDSKKPLRATLKVVRVPAHMLDDDDDEEDDEDYLDGLEDEEDSEDEDEDEENGGPSNKSKKDIKAALAAALAQDEEDDDDEDMEEDEDDSEEDEEDEAEALAALSKLIKSAKSKGKAKAVEGEEDVEEDEDSEDESESSLEMDEVVLCTLDPEKNYQQPLDFTVGEGEKIFFKVSGSHTVHLTGNYVIPADDGRASLYDSDEEDEEEGEEYDLSPDEDELDELDALTYGLGEESDELDDLEDPRVTEIASDEEAPKLIPATALNGKGKNKRPATDEDSEEEAANLDDIMAKSLKKDTVTNGDNKKLSKAEKKQAKKLKKNDGEAAPVESTPATVSETVVKKDTPNGTVTEKKVQFAKNLEQGPTPSATPPVSKAEKKKLEREAKKAAAAAPTEKKDEVALKATEAKKADKKAESTSKPTVGVRTVGGVTIDERKIGTGPAAKKGDRLEMRYIGKLDDGKVFDSNKSGKPFSFKVGKGEVIKGWDVGLEGVQAGGERRIIVPANLAYGNKALPGIPKGSRLTFDVKCLSVK